jgi:hypothetical protein
MQSDLLLCVSAYPIEFTDNDCIFQTDTPGPPRWLHAGVPLCLVLNQVQHTDNRDATKLFMHLACTHVHEYGSILRCGPLHR